MAMISSAAREALVDQVAGHLQSTTQGKEGFEGTPRLQRQLKNGLLGCVRPAPRTRLPFGLVPALLNTLHPRHAEVGFRASNEQLIVFTVVSIAAFESKNIKAVDRCITCHKAIDRKDPTKEELAWREKHKLTAVEWSKLPQPFRNHPKMDLFVGDTSPHPAGTFGCTVCHWGWDRETDFSRAGHTPNEEEQRPHVRDAKLNKWAPLPEEEQAPKGVTPVTMTLTPASLLTHAGSRYVLVALPMGVAPTSVMTLTDTAGQVVDTVSLTTIIGTLGSATSAANEALARIPDGIQTSQPTDFQRRAASIGRLNP